MQDQDFPALYRVADAKAGEEQKRFLRLQKAELIALVAAAALAEPSWGTGDVNASALASVIFLMVAIATRMYAASAHPERAWYVARAVAESAKTLTWQYAVGGEPFPIGDPDARSRFLDRVRELATRFPALDVPAGEDAGAQVTSAIETLRHSELSQRRIAYRESRVLDQQRWYSRKAVDNRTRARWWGRALLALEVLAAVLGLLRGLRFFDVDWSGVLAALAAAVLAWRQTKQYESLAQSYAVTSHDVAALASRLDEPGTEEQWATVVHDSEAAFSREHTMWLARRQARAGE